MKENVLYLLQWTDPKGEEHSAWCVDEDGAKQLQLALRGDSRFCSVLPSVEEVLDDAQPLNLGG